MPDDINPVNPGSNDPLDPADAGGGDPNLDLAPPNPAPQNPGAGAGNRNVVLPTAAMKRLKEEMRNKGRQEAMQSIFDATGVADEEGLKDFFAQLRQSQPQPPARAPARRVAQPPANNVDPDLANDQGNPPQQDPNEKRRVARDERERTRLQQERDTYQRRAQTEIANRQRLEEQLEAREAEMAIREVAVAAGMKDVDYGVRLLTRALEGKTEQELQAFDERKYFESLRTEKPYLFGETTVPVTTGTGAGNTPQPTPGGTNTNPQNNPNGPTFDARKAKPDDIRQRLRKLGLSLGT